MDDAVAEWVRLARRDIKTARVVLESGDSENALYLCQQALEKALKAHIQRDTADLPPRTHSLPRLATIAGLWDEFAPRYKDLLSEIDTYMIVARYGALAAKDFEGPTIEVAEGVVAQSEEVVRCLLRDVR